MLVREETRFGNFESAASTNSATPAPGARILVVCRSFVNKFVSANLFFYA